MLKVTSQLVKGDVVQLYGATYRLIEDARKVGSFDDDRYIRQDDIQCYGAKGELVEGNDFMSVSTWWFQGNDRASWWIVD